LNERVIKSASLSREKLTIGEYGRVVKEEEGFYGLEREREQLAQQVQQLKRKKSRLQSKLEAKKKRAHSMLEQTEEKAEQLKEQASEQGYEAGYKAGLAAGREEGRREAGERLAELLQVAERLVDETRAEKERLLAESEEEIVRLSLGIAEKIVKREVQTDSGVVRENFRRALAKINYRRGISVRIPPGTKEDLQVLMYEMEGLKPEGVTFEEDPSLTPGGCVVENHMGHVDARVESQLESIEKAFADIYGGELVGNGT